MNYQYIKNPKLRRLLEKARYKRKVINDSLNGKLQKGKIAANSDWFKEFNPIHAELISEYRNQNWENATSLSKKARGVAGEKYNGLYDLFDERIAEYQINTPGEDWDGVYIATDK